MMIRTHDRGVDVGEAVDLGGAEKAHVDTAALQPVAKDLGGGDHRVGGLSEVAVPDGERQDRWLGADRARLIYQDGVGCVRQAGEVCGGGWKSNPDEAYGAIAQQAGRSHSHHFIGSVRGTHWQTACTCGSLCRRMYSAKSRVLRMYRSIHAANRSRSRAMSSQA